MSCNGKHDHVAARPLGDTASCKTCKFWSPLTAPWLVALERPGFFSTTSNAEQKMARPNTIQVQETGARRKTGHTKQCSMKTKVQNGYIDLFLHTSVVFEQWRNQERKTGRQLVLNRIASLYSISFCKMFHAATLQKVMCASLPRITADNPVPKSADNFSRQALDYN